MSSPAISSLFPRSAPVLTDAELLTELDHPALRVNFVASIDGAATREGLSGGLSSAADKRLFGLLRQVADVVLVAAGTVRDEGYVAMRVDTASARWREANGKPPHPVFAIVSGSLNLDPASPIFADAPRPPILLTTRVAAEQRGALFAGLAEVVIAEAETAEAETAEATTEVGGHVDGALAAAALRERGLTRILCEGGPTFFGALIAADAVDEMFLTVEPTLEAGDARRIASGSARSADSAAPRGMQLARVLSSGSTLLLRYDRESACSAPGSPMMLSSSGA